MFSVPQNCLCCPVPFSFTFVPLFPWNKWPYSSVPQNPWEGLIFVQEIEKTLLNYHHLFPDLAPWLTLSGSNYSCLEQVSMVPRCSSHWSSTVLSFLFEYRSILLTVDESWYSWTSGERCEPWSDAVVYTVCSGLSAPVPRIITVFSLSRLEPTLTSIAADDLMGERSADDILKYFSYFSQKTAFWLSCELSPGRHFAWNANACFLG